MRRNTISTVRVGANISRAHYRSALGIAIALVVLALELIPFAGRPVAAAPGLQAACLTAALCLSGITAYVILTQFAATRALSLLLLGSAYWFGTLIGIPYLLGYIGVDLGTLTSASTSAWLWIFWHVGFALLALSYLVAEGQERTFTGSGPRIAMAASFVLLLAVVFLVQLVALPHFFPKPNLQTTGPALIAISFCVFLYALVVTRAGTILDTWLTIALLASLLDVLFTAYGGLQNTGSWYVSIFERALVSLVVLTAFLIEITTGSARLATLAALDALTTLPNRRGLDERLEEELDGGRRRNDELAVLMIDIDFFKDFNDRFGHAIGDEALRIVGKVIMRSLARTRDFAARYGGEEFAVILPDTDHAGALLVAERIRAGVARHGIGQHIGVAPTQIGTRVTVSIGVAAVGRRDIFDAAHILEAADRALYAAKESGRNCVRDSIVGVRRRDEGIRTA